MHRIESFTHCGPGFWLATPKISPSNTYKTAAFLFVSYLGTISCISPTSMSLLGWSNTISWIFIIPASYISIQKCIEASVKQTHSSVFLIAFNQMWILRLHNDNLPQKKTIQQKQRSELTQKRLLQKKQKTPGAQGPRGVRVLVENRDASLLLWLID